MLKKNDKIKLVITDITHEGSGVGRHEGMAVFVPASALGDELVVQILKVNKTHAFGKIDEVLSPSADRIAARCAVSRQCGGCVFGHVSYEAELSYKQNFVQSNLRRIGKSDLLTDPIVPSPQQTRYRNKAQYPVRLQKGKVCAGFFAPRSHLVVDSSTCELHPYAFGEMVSEILHFLDANQISIYDEATGKGLVRHIYLRQGARSGELMVCLVINGKSLPKADLFVSAVRAKNPQVVSVLLNMNRENTNVILGRETKLLYGKDGISDQLCGLTFHIAAHAFYQVNSPAAEGLYALAAEYAGLTGKETLVDLYCGAGTIGLSMAANCKEVIGVEVVPQAIENANENARQNGISNARFLCADAAQAAKQLLEEHTQPDVVVLDPPRKGCEQSVLESVVKMNPDRIVMISCNSATMARDVAFLAGMGYHAVRCRPVDLFPRTSHVETVVLLSRKTPRNTC